MNNFAMTNQLASAWGNVPMNGMYGMNPAMMMNPIMAQNLTATQTPSNQGTNVETTTKSTRLTGDDLITARIDADEHPVTSAHLAKAEELAITAKQILSGNGNQVDFTALDAIFYEVKKDPALADAFVQVANDLEFDKANNNTKTLLGSYEAALIEKYNGFGDGKNAQDAAAKVAKVKADLKLNVSERNEDSWSKFSANSSADKANTSDTFVDRFKKNKESILTAGLIGGGATTVAAGLATFGVLNSWNPVGWVALAAAGITGAVALAKAAK